MISMSSNGAQVAASVRAKGVALSKAIDAATKKSAVLVRAAAMKNTPVKTGHLRRGWKGPTSKGKWEYEVANAVEYAMYVEKGTFRFAGRHMLEQAVHEVEPIHKAAILAAIKVIM